MAAIRVVTLASLSALMVLAGSNPCYAADSKAEAKKKLLGTWKGKVEGGASGHVITFTAKGLTGKQNGSSLGTATIKIDATKSPMVMDATGTAGPHKGEVWLGIYEIKGDTLRWCVDKGTRPKKLTSSGNAFLLVLKKQKAK